jgi:hypothetical protein
MRSIIALLSGLLFALGLGFAGMTAPARVILMPSMLVGMLLHQVLEGRRGSSALTSDDRPL